MTSQAQHSFSQLSNSNHVIHAQLHSRTPQSRTYCPQGGKRAGLLTQVREEGTSLQGCGGLAMQLRDVLHVVLLVSGAQQTHVHVCGWIRLGLRRRSGTWAWLLRTCNRKGFASTRDSNFHPVHGNLGKHRLPVSMS